MDPRENPYAPGAGTPPPELAGRNDLIERASISLDRIRASRAAKSQLLVGLRGVGKTVLLNRIRLNAEGNGILCLAFEASENKSLLASLGPPLRAALLKLDHLQNAGILVRRALRALGGLAKAMKLKYGDIELGLDLDSEPGLADTGDLDSDLSDLLRTVGDAARERRTAVVMFIDELQYVESRQLAALISGLHRCAQDNLPVTLIGAGLPQLVGNAGKAKSYAERLFDFPTVGPLDHVAAADALETPASKLNVEYEKNAIQQIIDDTQAYPYFLQEWGKQSWNVAQGSPITLNDVQKARQQAVAELDASFFRVRFDRLTPSEKMYLRAMAERGSGPQRSGDVANVLRRKVQSVAPTRSSLIKKGMIYSSSHGDNAFTVPLFDDFIKRVVPWL
jgi:hypothetical protein